MNAADAAQSQPALPPQPSADIPTAVPIRPARRKLVITLGILLGLLCLCLTLCAGTLGLRGVQAMREQAQVERVIDAFMRAMADKDVEKAYGLCSTRFKSEKTMADLELALQGNNFVVFAGYQSLRVDSTDVLASINMFRAGGSPSTVMSVRGTVTYDDGYTGTFEAVMDREAEAWRVSRINVVVPPDKFGR